MIFGNLRNSMTRPTPVDHPRWSEEFFPLGNVRFRSVSKCFNNIFNISQVLVAGTESLQYFQDFGECNITRNIT